MDSLSREDYLEQLIHACKCKPHHDIENAKHKDKILSARPFDHHEASTETAFLLDHKNKRNIMIGWSKDSKFFRKAVENWSERENRIMTCLPLEAVLQN